MKDLDLDLFNFDTFFASNNDNEVDGLWALSATSNVSHDEGDLPDIAELEPLSSTNKPVHKTQEQAHVKQELANKHGLKIDTKLHNGYNDRSLASSENIKANGTPTSTLPARFALLSTTCVYEPGFTTSPRGKRRISQIHVAPMVDLHGEGDDRHEDGDIDGDEDGTEDDVAGGDEPFMLSGVEDYNLPLFTDAELSAMVEIPLEVSSTSTSSTALSAPRGPPHGAPLCGDRVIQDVTNTLSMDLGNDHGNRGINSMHNAIPGNLQSFSEAQQQLFETIDAPDRVNARAHCNVLAPSQAKFAAESVLSSDPNLVMPMTSAPNNFAGSIPLDYYTPSGYAAAANQFLETYRQHEQSFILNPGAALFQSQQAQSNADNVQYATAMAMSNPAGMNTMLKMNPTYGMPVAPVQCQAGSRLPSTQAKVTTPLKLGRPIQRAVSTTSTSACASNKSSRFAITPDIADFKLVQIFHHFCDPATKVLTLSRFQQLLLHHQIKETTTKSLPDSTLDVTEDVHKMFTVLDSKDVGVLDLERFMHSFQICNRCTEVKRRAHQALCARQGQVFTPTILEKQLMEDVAPVVVRVVPTCFEGHKVKSCEHYQWTWCEGFDATGNEKCRGTNRHDKCPKYLANCTLWKHKLPPKSRKPRILLENVDSPTKKLKHFS